MRPRPDHASHEIGCGFFGGFSTEQGEYRHSRTCSQPSAYDEACGSRDCRRRERFIANRFFNLL
jgi:hypothetical protein